MFYFYFFKFFFSIFFRISMRGSSLNRIRDQNFFLFSFSGYLFPFWLEIMPESGFLIFCFFLLFCSEFSCPGRVWTEFGTKFFFSFSAYLIPFWLEIMPKSGFLIFFLIFLLFSLEFSCSGRVWTDFRSKIFFFLFFGLSHPVLAENNAGNRVLNFLNFFSIFFIISLCGLSLNGIRD